MRIRLLSTAAMLMAGTLAYAQPDLTSDDVVKKNYEVKEQHSEWKKGNYKFPSKPKDMLEVGLYAGWLQYSGDVNAQFGLGYGLHLRKSLGYTFAVRLQAFTGTARGMNYQPSRVAASKDRAIRSNYGVNNPFYYNFRSNYTEASLQGIITLNNLKFHRQSNKWNLYLIGGVGINIYSTQLGAQNSSGQWLDFRDVSTGLDVNKAADRKTARERVRNIIKDADYSKVQAEQWGGLFDIAGDDATSRGNFIANAGVGLGYRLSKRVTLTLEHQTTLVNDDLLDGLRWAEQGDLTRADDVVQFTTLRLGIHLGNSKKAVEPLWWMNPLTPPYSDLASMKKNNIDVENLLADSDGDGVPDKLDKEPNTPKGYPVDTHGVQLDSDGDGIPDGIDKERFSAPGAVVDADGVGNTPKGLTKAEADKLYAPIGSVGAASAGKGGDMGEWFLPMINFDLDKYYIKPQMYANLQYVATVMKQNPSLNVVVNGYTDNRLDSDYNKALSYKRANQAIEFLVKNYNLPRNRFILQYGGMENPLVPGLPNNHSRQDLEYSHYMNRRVEFRVATANDKEMGVPSVPNFDKVGSNTPGSSRSGRIYSGNPGSNY